MIHVLSVNTAHEVILAVPRLAAGHVHRATDGYRRVGGKGVNVARACGRMGTRTRLVAVADARGAGELASEPDIADGTLALVPLEGDARTDVIVAEADGRSTVVNGVGDPVPPATIERAVDLLLADVEPEDIVVLAGSLPRGVPVGLYADVVAEVRARGARTIVDASGPWLRATLPAAPDVCKVNVGELAMALDVSAGECWRRGGTLVPGATSLVLSAAARGARVWAAGRRASVRVPAQTVVCAVGAGDAMTAGVAAGLATGMPLPDAAAQGAAWGAAAVRELDLTLDADVAREIAARTRVVGRVPA